MFEKIAKKYSLDYFDVNLVRQSIPYTVTYLMHKNHSPYKVGDKKYAMYIKWGKGDKVAIVIGQNPSVCQTIDNCKFHPDNTNWNIIKILRNMGYDGYIMLNTFAEIDSKGTKINIIQPQKLNISISYDILSSYKNIDVIIACTINNYIALDYMKAIKNRNDLNLCVCEGKNKDGVSKYIYHFSQQNYNLNYKANAGVSIKKISSLEYENDDSSKNICKWTV
ncbi:MAG: DUF1643 domain-containing protein [Ruminococcus sp.]|nr:DUF1643 domain-containing protein [Ruminococcus sp.]